MPRYLCPIRPDDHLTKATAQWMTARTVGISARAKGPANYAIIRTVHTVKKTRHITVSEKVFTAEDLRRLAALFDRQSKLAAKSQHRSSVEFQIRFDDTRTIYEADSLDLFTDESLVSTSRPRIVAMSFSNFTMNRHITLSLDRATDSNTFRITSEEGPWAERELYGHHGSIK